MTNSAELILRECDIEFVMLIKKAESYAEILCVLKDKQEERKDAIIQIIKESIETMNNIKNYDITNLSKEIKDTVEIIIVSMDLTILVYEKMLEHTKTVD